MTRQDIAEIARAEGGRIAADPMRLKTIVPVAVRLPLSNPIKMAGVTMTVTENVLVRIEDERGNVGWGEACSAPTMTGETAGGMVAAVRYLASLLEGADVEDIALLSANMDRLLYGNTAAKSAIEMAAFDVLGRRCGLPVYELLGGRRRSRAPILWMLAAGDRDRERAEARGKADQGFQAFKVKVGTGGGQDGVARDLERAALARDTLGAGAQISADANQGYSRAEALAFVAALEPSVLDFFEQPVAGHDLAGMRDVVRAARVAIGADEGIHSIDDIKGHAAAAAAHGVSLKTIKLGGLAAVMAAGATTDALGMTVNLAGKIADSSIASAAIAHLAVALPQIDWGVSITNQYLTGDVSARPLLVEAGHVTPPDAPGLGIDVDEGRVASFAFKPDI